MQENPISPMDAVGLNRAWLILGGSGSLGQSLSKLLLRAYQPKVVRILSRDEFKQAQMARQINDKRMRYLIGDIRDVQRLKLAMQDIDIVIHAAAMKRIEVCARNPFEAVRTNVIGTMNALEAALAAKVQKFITVSTDKCVDPINHYGKTKAVCESMTIAANEYTAGNTPLFACVRYGNVYDSRGSLYQAIKQAERDKTTVEITDPTATRFWMKKEEAANFVAQVATRAISPAIYVPHMDASTLKSFIEHHGNDVKWTTKGELTDGEKLHESLISNQEWPYTLISKSWMSVFPNRILDVRCNYSPYSSERGSKYEFKPVSV